MVAAPATAFALPARLSAKADPALIAADERRFSEIAEAVGRQIAGLEERLAAQRLLPARGGQEAMDRDLEVHRLSARLRLLRRFGLDVCLGRIVSAEHPDEPAYIGRIGLADETGRRLLIDWRAAASEPFFAATHAVPMGLLSRRRYRWSAGRVVDYWDEVFDADGLAGRAALDDQSAFIASLGESRTPRMRDVLATIQSDQDAIIRSGARGALVVDGGPGTGKTVVALHRAAYLLYADPHLGERNGGVLFVGPHQAYLDYVADVLPGLGEEGVRTCTLRDLVPEGAVAAEGESREAARLKASAALERAVEAAVASFEQPPTRTLRTETPWADVRLSAVDWADAFASAEPGTPHNEAREQVWETLVGILVSQHDEEVPERMIRAALAEDEELVRAFDRAWPLLDPAGLVAALWTRPELLGRCAPWLGADEVRALRREDAAAWTTADLPVLDAARARIGDPGETSRRRRSEAALAAQSAYMDDVVQHLVQADDDTDLGLMKMLGGADVRTSLVDEAEAPAAPRDRLAGPFAHVIVDEAQELTDAQWRMLLRRCPSRSFTIVGDRAQARHGFTGSWRDRLGAVGLREVGISSLRVNYRTPEEIMTEAEPVIRAALPDANVPVSVRRSGIPVHRGTIAERDGVVERWLAEHQEGVACVIGDPSFAERPRVRSLTPSHAKGLEFDLVVLVDPDALGDGIEGAVDRYVSMTRATGRLVILDDR